jgi:hypothetical protein
MLLAYLSKVRSMFQEIRRLNVLNLFSNVNNVDAVLEKLPNVEVEKWLEYSAGLLDNQLATALEKFVTQRWTYATTLVSRTTSADQALMSMGIGGGGGGGQQGGARPGSPKNGNKNNKKNWWEKKKENSNGNGGTSQVPVAVAQPSSGGGSQNAQPSQILAVGAFNQRGSGANGQNNQTTRITILVDSSQLSKPSKWVKMAKAAMAVSSSNHFSAECKDAEILPGIIGETVLYFVP